MTDKQWKRIFKALSVDISDRRGLKWEWSQVSPMVKRDISQSWRDIVEAELVLGDVKCEVPDRIYDKRIR